ncbi:MAG: hypothetical protein J7494_03305 [Sphingobium sp.]|nr:hypothetical protein [Sphingobium sp.]
MFTQLNPPIPLHVLDKGSGFAIGLIDYGQEHNLIWVTALDNGEIWCAPNPKVRMQKNWTMGRPESPAVAAAKQAQRTELCEDCREAVG